MNQKKKQELSLEEELLLKAVRLRTRKRKLALLNKEKISEDELNTIFLESYENEIPRSD